MSVFPEFVCLCLQLSPSVILLLVDKQLHTLQSKDEKSGSWVEQDYGDRCPIFLPPFLKFLRH